MRSIFERLCSLSGSAVVVVTLLVLLAAPGLACEDRDGDGYFDVAGCGTKRDCDDMNVSAHPGAVEECNGRDDDCDGTLDEGCASVCSSAEAHLWGDRVEGHGDRDQSHPHMVRARHGYGLVWQSKIRSSACAEMRFVRLADDGSLVAGPVRLVGEQGARGAVGELGVVWAGRDFFAAWTDYPRSEDCSISLGVRKLFLQCVSPDGRARGPVREVSCDTYHVSFGAIVWTGRYVIVFWQNTLTDEWFVTRFTPDGEPLDPCTRTLVPRTWDTTGTPAIGDVQWNGSELGVVFTQVTNDPAGDDWEIWFERYTEDLERIDPYASRVSHTMTDSARPRLAWTGSEWGVVFESRDRQPVGGDTDVAFMRLERDGTPIDPPGLIWLTASVIGDSYYVLPEITWTGEEFGAFYQAPRPYSSDGDVWFTRVSREGLDLSEEDVLVSVDTAQGVLFHSPVWSGKEFAVALDHTNVPMDRNEVRFQKLGCVCNDNDGDMFTTCRGGDCDDDDPFVNPGASSGEICGNGIDDNCDGLADCADGTACPPLGELPEAPTSLTWLSDGVTLQWSAAAGADAYDLTRGTLVNLSYDQDFAFNECLVSDLAATSHADPEVPQTGDGFHYLVRSQVGPDASCRVSTWGSTLRDESLDACP